MDRLPTEEEKPSSNIKKPLFQFTIRSLLIATVELALVLSFLSFFDKPYATMIYCGLLILASVISRSVHHSIIGASCVLLCVYLALILGENIGPNSGRFGYNMFSAFFAAILLIASSISLYRWARFTFGNLFSALVFFEIFLFLLIVHISGEPIWNIFLDLSEFKWTLDWFIFQRGYIALPWLLGIGAGIFLQNKFPRAPNKVFKTL